MSEGWQSSRRAPGVVTWTVDPDHTTVTFSVRLLGLSLVEGRFHDILGSAQIDPRRRSSARGVALVRVASLDTGDAALDAMHLSPDVFDAGVHPHITFRSTSVTATGATTYLAVGDLTIRGVTCRTTFDAEDCGIVIDSRGQPRARLTMRGSIDRADFGLTRSHIFARLLGATVGLAIKAELVAQTVDGVLTE